MIVVQVVVGSKGWGLKELIIQPSPFVWVIQCVSFGEEDKKRKKRL